MTEIELQKKRSKEWNTQLSEHIPFDKLHSRNRLQTIAGSLATEVVDLFFFVFFFSHQLCLLSLGRFSSCGCNPGMEEFLVRSEPHESMQLQFYWSQGWNPATRPDYCQRNDGQRSDSLTSSFIGIIGGAIAARSTGCWACWNLQLTLLKLMCFCHFYSDFFFFFFSTLQEVE